MRVLFYLFFEWKSVDEFKSDIYVYKICCFEKLKGRNFVINYKIVLSLSKLLNFFVMWNLYFYYLDKDIEIKWKYDM